MIERESEAWRALAEAYDAKTVESWFLCHAKDELPIAHDVRVAMRVRMELDINPAKYVAYDPDVPEDADMTTKEMRAARVLACLMFAEEAEGERR
jgi:hypothetical protein